MGCWDELQDKATTQNESPQAALALLHTSSRQSNDLSQL